MVKGKNQQSTFCKKRADNCILLYYVFYYNRDRGYNFEQLFSESLGSKRVPTGRFALPLFLLVDNLLAWLNWGGGGSLRPGVHG